MAGVIQQVQFKKSAKRSEEKKDHEGCEVFEDFAGLTVQSRILGVSANYNAAVDYEKAGQPGKALANVRTCTFLTDRSRRTKRSARIRAQVFNPAV